MGHVDYPASADKKRLAYDDIPRLVAHSDARKVAGERCFSVQGNRWGEKLDQSGTSTERDSRFLRCV